MLFTNKSPESTTLEPKHLLHTCKSQPFCRLPAPLRCQSHRRTPCSRCRCIESPDARWMWKIRSQDVHAAADLSQETHTDSFVRNLTEKFKGKVMA